MVTGDSWFYGNSVTYKSTNKKPKHLYEPSLRLVTPSPTETTTALDSCPSTVGAVSFFQSPKQPCDQRCTSLPHIPTERIASNTSDKIT